MEFPIQWNFSSVTWLYIGDESTTNNAPPSWFEIVGASPSIRVTPLFATNSGGLLGPTSGPELLHTDWIHQTHQTRMAVDYRI
jgi:hypothetical protein